ncbi:slipin family protein [Desulfobacterales bacterium HSG16]|nr:slipin family protein [Desulfobacterales bacterium HSG16]
MYPIKRVVVCTHEKGLVFKEGEFKGFLDAGKHRYFDLFNRVQVDVVSQRDPWLDHRFLDVLINSGEIAKQIIVIDLKDHERALVWIDNRFARILTPGLYALWTTYKKIRHEIVDARNYRFDHPDMDMILANPDADKSLRVIDIREGFSGVMFEDGKYVKILAPGRYVFWNYKTKIEVIPVDIRETATDISGQEIMTADKVTLRMNTLLSYRVVDAKKAVCETENFHQTLYRKAQLALRAIVGTRTLDVLLGGKESIAQEMEEIFATYAKAFGLKITGIGIRDIILPGEMKSLMNKVIEAGKSAEANLISRREETAAMRSQANTAKLLDNHPTLMRLKELEVLERISENAKINVVLGEKGLADRVINLI